MSNIARPSDSSKSFSFSMPQSRTTRKTGSIKVEYLGDLVVHVTATPRDGDFYDLEEQFNICVEKITVSDTDVKWLIEIYCPDLYKEIHNLAIEHTAWQFYYTQPSND